METTSTTNTATFIHLSTLSQYFIPFGNYIFPILIWNSKKKDSEFVDFHGKQVLNFQISMLLYTLILLLITIPILIYTVFQNITISELEHNHKYIFNHLSIENHGGIIIVAVLAILTFLCLKISEFFLIIYASLKTSNGEKYKYPLTIPFIK